MPSLGPVELILNLILVLFLLIPVIPLWRIFGKAGFSPFLSLLMFVPLINFVMLFVLAFAEWPSLQRQGVTPAVCPNCGYSLSSSVVPTSRP